MAGDWMKVEKVTPDKPEIEAMAAALSMDPDAVFGKCFRVWRWFDDHTTDGNAPSVTKSAVDRRAGVTGFSDAMEKVGWLVESSEGVSLPRFERHNGETSKQRALTAKRVSSHKRKGNATANAPVTHESLPREEKRREPPPVAPAAEASTPVDVEWEEVEEALLSEGVARASEAVDAARSNACHPIDVRRVVSHYRSKKPAWEEGALFERIRILRSGQDPAAMWPAPSKAAQVASNTAQRVAQASKAAEVRMSDQAIAEQEFERFQRLEADHGAAIDALDREAIRKIIFEVLEEKPATQMLRSHKMPTTGMLRTELLEYFEAHTASSARSEVL
jgi:hypothetical protein